MPSNTVIVIRDDPRQSAKPVEALRIALGLSTGDTAVTVILLDRSSALLDENEEVIDADTRDQYLPSLKQVHVTFVVPDGTGSGAALSPDFRVTAQSPDGICSLVTQADRVLVF